jgi:hypothetical protein
MADRPPRLLHAWRPQERTKRITTVEKMKQPDKQWMSKWGERDMSDYESVCTCTSRTPPPKGNLKKTSRNSATRTAKFAPLVAALLLFGFSGGMLAPSPGPSASFSAGVNALMDSSWTAESDQLGANFGYSVSSAGDVNDDGFGDVIVGALNFDNGQTDEGRAFLYLGTASGLSTSYSWSAESDQAYARFGYSVSAAGDVNNDGFGDILVGAYVFDNGETDEGRAFMYLGSASGPSATPSWTAEGNQASGYFGSSVSSAGDVNNDGYDDVLVAALFHSNGENMEGKVFLYLGSSTGLSTSPSWTAEGNQAYANFGRSVSSAGDVNNDGYDDVIIGAYYYDNGESNEGRAFLYLGSASGLSTTPIWTGESNQANAQFGYSVSSAGDVNGDGYSDVIVSAVGYHNPEANEGCAYVYLGSASGLSSSPSWTAESNQASAYLGVVSSAGDVDNDGFGDVLVGAYFYDNDTQDEGRVYLYLGSALGLSASPSGPLRAISTPPCSAVPCPPPVTSTPTVTMRSSWVHIPSTMARAMKDARISIPTWLCHRSRSSSTSRSWQAGTSYRCRSWEQAGRLARWVCRGSMSLLDTTR